MKMALAFLASTHLGSGPRHCGQARFDLTWLAHGLPRPSRPGDKAWPGPGLRYKGVTALG
jgi:hypothetical protein